MLLAQSRTRSAPCLPTKWSAAVGFSYVPDLEIFLPSRSTTKPCVTHVLYGARLFSAMLVMSDDWNQPRCWSVASRYMSAGSRNSGWTAHTALCETPLSIQTSIVSVPLIVSGGNPTSFAKAASSNSNQIFEPRCATRSANLRMTFGSRMTLPSLP